MSEVQALALIGAAVLAGIGYNTLGIWRRYRDQGEASIVWAKVRKNVIIGSILGVLGYVFSLANMVPIPEVTGIETFALAAWAYFPIVIIADGIFTKQSEEVDV